ncbi:MAG: hypothetical protein HKN01_01530 [Acidimicrobiia bacterium]|nr:hypothetical protein [Acidimicrobiia bacterium]
MASVLYPKGKEAFLAGDIALDTDTIKVALVDTGTYTYTATHQFYSELSGVVGTDGTLANKSITDGVFDADNLVWTAVSGATVEAVVIYKDTGVAATSPLIAFIDDDTVTPNGGDITAVWSAGANRIFAL